MSQLYSLEASGPSVSATGCMFYQSGVASTIFYAMVCWGGGIKAKDANRLNELIKEAGSVIGSKLVTLEEVAEDRMLEKLLIMDNTSHLVQHDSQTKEQISCRVLSDFTTLLFAHPKRVRTL